jgi:hypothetical protein
MKYITLAILLGLTACGGEVGTEIVTSTKQIVVLPPEKLYECPQVESFPDPKKLTDLQVARLLVLQHSKLVQCKNSLDALKKFLEDAKRTVETSN